MDKKGVKIAIFLGWCGGYRFYKKQYVSGIVYLFTLGLFGFGWIFDIILSLFNKAAPAESKLTEIARFHTRVVGVTYETTQGGYDTRQEALASMMRKDTLSIEYFEYKGDPAYRVVLDRNYSDIGNLSAELAAEIYRKYKDCVIKVVDWEVTGGENRQKYGCNIELAFYK